MGNERITLEREGGAGVIRFNRPSAKNAVDLAMALDVGRHLEELNRDPSVAVIILTGVGDCFCAGADLKEMVRGDLEFDPLHPEGGLGRIVRQWVTKPTIAAVNGLALGGGAEIAMWCDIVVADESATFGLPEVKRGLMAGAGGLIRLPRLVPTKVALEMIMTGDPITAMTAAHWGLVNRVAKDGECLEVALSLAANISSNSPTAVRESRALVYESLYSGSEWRAESWHLNADAFQRVRRSRDSIEGPRAFAEGRDPCWGPPS